MFRSIYWFFFSTVRPFYISVQGSQWTISLETEPFKTHCSGLSVWVRYIIVKDQNKSKLHTDASDMPYKHLRKAVFFSFLLFVVVCSFLVGFTIHFLLGYFQTSLLSVATLTYFRRILDRDGNVYDKFNAPKRLQDCMLPGELKWHMYEQVQWPGGKM